MILLLLGWVGWGGGSFLRNMGWRAPYLSFIRNICNPGYILTFLSTETLLDWQVLDENLTSVLWRELPMLNSSGHSDPSSLNLEKIRDILVKRQQGSHGNLTALSSQLAASGIVIPPAGM